MNCGDLLNKRVVFLSGKGGVGKSILAAALALCAARSRRRTLLVELDTMETLPGIFRVPDPQENYREHILSDHISCLHVDGKSGLEEYLEMVLKSKRLTRRIFRSPIYQYFVNIAPGLKELMAVGKIWDLERKLVPATARPQHDLIIVDTPATGHTLSYLQMPMTAADTVRKGFVNKEAQKVVDLLRDPARTSFHIVTTPAEMPVNEALELHDKVSGRLKIPLGCLFVNQVYPSFFEGEDLAAFRAWKRALDEEQVESARAPGPSSGRIEQDILACAESWERRRAAQDHQLERLRRRCGTSLVLLPLVAGCENDLDRARHLSRILDPEGGPGGPDAG